MAFILDKTLDIDAPAAVVWEVITDLSHYGEWNPFCLECKSTLKPGDPIDMVVQITEGKPQRQREWISEYVEGRSFAYRIKPAPLGALTSRRSQEVAASGTGLTRYRTYFELRGWFAPVVRSLVGKKLIAGFAGMNEAVKRRAEALWAQRQAAPQA